MKKLLMCYLFFELRGNLNFKKMKLTLLLSFLIFSVSWAESYSQSTALSLNLRKVPVRKFIQEIEDQTDYYFLYQDDVIDEKVRITIQVDNEPLERILTLFEEQASVNATITGDQIVLKRNYELPELSSRQPVMQINGFVHDQGGQPLPGVSVFVKGTTIGTTTSANGEFSMGIPADSEVLVFSFVGMRQQEVAIAGQSTFNIVMEEEIFGMEEVIVVGYGTQKKSDITGTVASMPKERLEMLPNLNISQAIQGAVAGVMVRTTSSGAQPDQTILVRGRNSITADNDPLIVVDGIPYGGHLTDINPNHVESVEVLKDASAAAIYGSRGSNGVILITTKEGEIGKTRLTYEGRYILTDVTKVHNILTGPEFYEFKLERNPQAMTQSEEEVYREGIWTDWPQLSIRTGHTHEHNMSFSGGFEENKYYLGLGVTDIRGVAKNDNFLRLSGRINVETKIFDIVTVGTRTNLSVDDASGQPANFDIRTNPLSKAYDEYGNLTIHPWPDNIIIGNPLGPMLYDDLDRSYQVLTNNYAVIDFPFIEGLSYQFNSGLIMQSNEQSQYKGRDTQKGFETMGESNIDNSVNNNTVIENILTFTREFANHTLFLTGLYSYEGNKRRSNSLDGNKFPNDFLSWYATSEAAVKNTGHSYSETHLISQMLRTNYSYDSRYLVTLTIRRDGYSGFGSDSKWGTFPSLALGWNLANENFFPLKNLFSELKLRTSFGLNGNQAIRAYESLSQYTVANYSAGSTPVIGYKPSRLGLTDLGWESSRTFNFGFDFGIFDGRIRGDFNWYLTNTKDLLLGRSISAIHGITPVTHLPGGWVHPAVTSNIGETQNNGIEAVINSRNIVTNNFIWSTQGNFSFNKNKIISLYGFMDETGNEIDDISNKWFIGQPVRVIYDFIWDGTWQLDEAEEAAKYGTQPGWVKLKDVDDDGKLTADDRRILGQQDPKILWGLNNTFSYKNLTLSIFMHGVHGQTVKNWLMNDHVQGEEVRYNTYRKNWWTPDNPTNDWIINRETADQMAGFEGTWYEKTDFLRIKDVSLSYDLTQSLNKIINVSRLRVYFTGRNLAVITGWSGLDPELIDEKAQKQIPMQKEYVFGVSLGL